jgi:two-component system sensor histidine kinase PilS (NtrC family)
MDGPALRRALAWLSAVRLAVLLLIVISAVLVQAGSGARLEISFLWGVNAGALLLALFHATVGRHLTPRFAAALQLAGDLAIVTVLVYSSGASASVFNFFYLVVIGVAAVLLSRTEAVVCATLAAVLYGGMVQLLAYGLLPQPALAVGLETSPGRLRYGVAITVAGFYAVAFMVSYLADNLRSARRELEVRQKALSRLQNLHGNVIATMSSGLLTTDGKGRVTFVNRAGGVLLGIDPGAAPGRTLDEVGFAFPWDWESVRQKARGRETFRGEIEIERGFERREIGYSLKTIREGEEHEEGALLLFQDLTEIKKLERRARFNEQLAAVGELAAGIAHEIRNPLASISGSVQVLQGELEVGSAERRLMEIIVSESNRLSKILEDFLRFVRPQERRVADFDVAVSVSEVLELFRRSEEISDRHEVRVVVEPTSSILSGDRDQIRQIVYNIAKNAVRAMPAGGTLTVRGAEEDGWYTIRFSDTGQGMSEEQVARLFTPFATAFDGGTGLGMAIVRRIVEDHGGAIDVDSRPGEGTTVTVLLPRPGAGPRPSRELTAAAERA